MTRIPSASSSSATVHPAGEAETLDVDLIASGGLPPIPTALLDGRDHDLLAPLRFLMPGDTPRGLPAGMDRRELASALARANAALGHPRAEALGERLADPDTRVVVTGQQPGLYGGPLLALTKLVAAVRWADELSAQGQPAIAVFWVATEDSDWAETTRASLLTRDGAATYDLGDDPEPLKPLGERVFGPRLAELHERIAGELGHDLAAAAFRSSDRFFHPEASFGDAFCRFLIDLLRERAPLFLDAQLPVMKRLQRPWLRRLVERRTVIDRGLVAAGDEVEKRGYPLQVSHQAGTSPLFLVHEGQRRRIVWSGDEIFCLRGLEDECHDVAELLRLGDEEPERLIPSALARPALQDALLGTTLQVMGPAEISYLAQASAIYWELEVEPPWTALRPQVLLLEERQLEHLRELGVSPGEVIAAESVDLLLAERLGENLVDPARRRLEAVFDELKGPLMELDATLESPWRKTRGHVGRAFDQLSGKIATAVARHHEVWRRRLEQIRETCLPDGVPQERHLAVAHFTARYGRGVAELLLAELDLDPRRLQVLQIQAGGER